MNKGSAPQAGLSRYEMPYMFEVSGRKVSLRRTLAGRRVALATFDELCGQPLGSADYIGNTPYSLICVDRLLVMYVCVLSCWCVALGERLHVLFISHIPRMTMPTNRNELRRFILLIDALYEAQTRVIILADVPVMELLTISAADRASSVHDEVRALLIYTILYYTIQVSLCI